MRPSAAVACLGGMLGLVVAVTTFGADLPRDLDQYVVLGAHGVELGPNTFVAAGHVGVNESGGTLLTDRELFMSDGSTLVADRLALGAGSSVSDVFTNDLASPPGSIVVRGQGPTAFAPLIAPLPPLPPFAPGTTPVNVRGDETVVLPGGAYGAVVVGKKAILRLAGGTYQLASVDVQLLGRIIVDAPSVVNVQGDFKLAAFTSFGPASSTLGARQIRVNVGGTSVRFGDTTHADMDLLAPNARIVMSRSFRGEGRFIGESIRGEVTVNLQLMGMGPGGAPPAQFCTLTQEVYGAPAGPQNPLGSILGLAPDVLPVTVGALGINSLTVTDVPRLICLLPATGLPAALSLRLTGDPDDVLVDACSNPPIIDFVPAGDGSSGGLGAGELLGETIATKLNVALSRRGVTPAGLGDFRLPERLCTTRCPRGREINPNPMKVQTGAVGVSDGLTTVGGLLNLADQALAVPRCRPGTCAGTTTTAIFPPNPIRMSDIQNALDAINECFRGCATLIPCDG